MAANPPQASFEFDTPRTIHQVIASYFLALKTYEVTGASPDLWANLWLRLMWIYEDLEAEELALQAAEKARTYFAESLATTARSAAGDQRLYLILAELDLLGQRDVPQFPCGRHHDRRRSRINGWPRTGSGICGLNKGDLR